MYEVDPSYKVGDVFEPEEEVLVIVGDPIVQSNLNFKVEVQQV